MKKILILLFLLFSSVVFSQTVVECKRGGKQIGSPVLDTLAADTNIYFRFTEPVSAYTIQMVVVSTIEGADVGVRLYGSNYMGEFTQIGSDSVKLDSAVATFATAKYFTGTVFPWAVGRLTLTDIDLLTTGQVKILVYSQ